MKVVFDSSFSKSLRKLKVKWLKKKIEDTIVEAENASTIHDIANVKKLQGFKSFYRIRIGDYRIGIELEDNATVRFIIVLHRKDIYREFP